MYAHESYVSKQPASEICIAQGNKNHANVAVCTVYNCTLTQVGCTRQGGLG